MNEPKVRYKVQYGWKERPPDMEFAWYSNSSSHKTKENADKEMADGLAMHDRIRRGAETVGGMVCRILKITTTEVIEVL